MNDRLVLFLSFLAVVGLVRVPLASTAPLTTSKLSILEDVEAELKKLVDSGEAEFGTVTCDVCKIIVGTIQKLYDTNTAWDDIASVAGDICYWFKIEDKNVCKSIAQEFKVSLIIITVIERYWLMHALLQDEILSVVGQVGLNSSEVCGGYLGTNCGSTYDPWNQTWSLPIPGGKPPVKPFAPPKVSPSLPTIFTIYNKWQRPGASGMWDHCAS